MRSGVARSMLFAALASCGCAHAAGWQVVFEDDFDGQTLDRTRWATRYIHGNEKQDHIGSELSRYRDNDNHFVANSELALVARPVEGGLFDSGMIRSLQTFYYGYFEARVWLPKGRGVFPAFWLIPDYDAEGKLFWPPEIDIFEYAVNGKDSTEAMFHSSASNYPIDAPLDYLATGPKYAVNARMYVGDRPLNDAWHVFGLVWTPQSITVFFDGALVFSRKYRWARDEDGAFAGPAHVLLNFGVGGNWAGKYGIDYERFPQALRIDSVRVCQMARGAGGHRQCGSSTVTPDPDKYGYVAPFDDLPKPSVADAQVMNVADGRKTDELRDGDRARIAVPITLPSGAEGLRTLRVMIWDPTKSKPTFTALEPFPVPEPNPGASNTLSVVMPIGGKFDGHRYDVVAEVLHGIGKDATTRTPIRCQSARDVQPKARACKVSAVKLMP
ncbi:MAG: glycoside hydrolase family 16 protein [Steroidobacteraceae bacterium]